MYRFTIIHDIISGQLSSESPELCDPSQALSLMDSFVGYFTQWLSNHQADSQVFCHPLCSDPRFDTHLPVTFRGGLKNDDTGHHAFLFVKRQGIPKSTWCLLGIRLALNVLFFGACLCTESLADLPRQIIVKADDQFGALESHEMDVVCLVKRNAADDVLAQDPWNQWRNSQIINSAGGSLISLFAQYTLVPFWSSDNDTGSTS